MKGHTKIELTNVTTGDTEVYEDDNLFTDIFGELVNDNGFGYTAIASTQSFLPLSTKSLGGIALFPEAQTASATHMYPSQRAMAYAGSDTDAGSNVNKGTYNVTESGAITNGYKHVWDFTTSQGNGEIASVSLVHYMCGNSWPSNPIHTVANTGSGSEGTFIGSCKLINQSAQLFAGYDPESEHIQVRRIETILDSLSSVNATYFSDSCPYTVEKDIVINSDTDKNHVAHGMVWRVVGSNAIGYGHSSNSSGDAYIYTITIDVNTLDYTESSITISDADIKSFGYGRRFAVTRNGYLYCRRNSDNKLLKINLSNTTDITEIDDTNSYLGYDEVLDYVLLSDSRYLYPDDSIGSGSGFSVNSGLYVPIATLGIKELIVANSGSNSYHIITPRLFLGTINNLDSMVVKTASQTMKITYTITDSTEVVLRGISVTHAPTTTRYAVGSTLNTTGLEVTAVYSGGTTEVVTSDCVLSPANGATLSDTSVSSISISYTDDDDNTRTTSTPITVYGAASLAVTTQPTQTLYTEGDTLDLTGLVITATMTDGTTQDVTSSCTFSPANGATLTVGTAAVTATYTLGNTVTTTIPITVRSATLSSIAVTTEPTKKYYGINGTLDLTGIVITATFSDSSTQIVTSDCTFSPADGSTLSTAGSQSISVSYTSGGVTRTTSFTVLVSQAPSGESATPTDDIQTWLACGAITDKSYTTLNEVLADTTTLQTLISDNNACDYLVRSTSWATSMCSNQTAMSYIGADDYCSNKLLGNSTWLSAIANSTYFESVLNVSVPTMTSNTTPSGEVLYDSDSGNENYQAWKSFDGSDSTRWSSSSSTGTHYIGYKFTSQKVIKMCTLLTMYDSNYYSTFDGTIQGSDDNSTWVDIDEVTFQNPSNKYLNKFTFMNNTAYQYYRVLFDGAASSYNGSVTFFEMQFYGRE